MGIADPRESHGDANKDEHRKEEAEVSWSYARSCSKNDVAHRGDERWACDERAPETNAVRDERCAHDGEEAEDVGRRRESVGLDCAEGTHFRDDGGNEKGERGEADVASEVHQRREVG